MHEESEDQCIHMEQSRVKFWAQAGASLALPISRTVYRPMGITIHHCVGKLVMDDTVHTSSAVHR